MQSEGYDAEWKNGPKFGRRAEEKGWLREGALNSVARKGQSRQKA